MRGKHVSGQFQCATQGFVLTPRCSGPVSTRETLCPSHADGQQKHECAGSAPLLALVRPPHTHTHSFPKTSNIVIHQTGRLRHFQNLTVCCPVCQKSTRLTVIAESTDRYRILVPILGWSALLVLVIVHVLTMTQIPVTCVHG